MMKKEPDGEKVMLSDYEQKYLHTLLGQRIRLLRKQRYLTQDQLAKRIGISRSFLSRIEHGMRNVTYDELCELSNVFMVSTSELLFGVELPKEEPPQRHFSDLKECLSRFLL